MHNVHMKLYLYNPEDEHDDYLVVHVRISIGGIYTASTLAGVGSGSSGG